MMSTETPDALSWMRLRMVWIMALAVVAGVVVSVVAAEVPELIPATIIVCVALYGWHTYRISGAGTVLAVGALQSVTLMASVTYRSHCLAGSFIPFTCLLFVGGGFLLASIVVFLVEAFRVRMQRCRNLLAAVVVVGLVVLWCDLSFRVAIDLREWQLDREIVRSGLPELAAAVTEATERLGRCPRDERELVGVLGEPLPVISRGPVTYHRPNSENFTLTFGCCLDVYQFDSRFPERGWHHWLPDEEETVK